MKNRMTVVDVKVMVEELKEKLVGMRCANVYDYNQKTYMFKMALPDKPKIFLLMESGIRFHATDYAREKSDIPSGFSMKLRKHIRTKRLENVRQFGMDRVVDFQFGLGESAFHVILELYASGNIILTDSNYEILNLLRTHKYEEDVAVAVRQVYPISHAADGKIEHMLEGEETDDQGKRVYLSEEEVDAAASLADIIKSISPTLLVRWLLKRASEMSAGNSGNARQEIDADSTTKDKGKKQKDKGKKDSEKAKKEQDKKQAKKLNLKQILSSKGSGVEAFGPVVVEHCLVSAGLKPNLKLTKAEDIPEENATKLLEALRAAPRLIESLGSAAKDTSSSHSSSRTEGFIILTDVVNDSQQARIESMDGSKLGKEQEGESALYEDFVPYLFAQYHGCKYIQFPSFGAAVDEYFSRIESQQAAVKRAAAEKAALQKVERIRQDHQSRIKSLDEAQNELKRKAYLLEYHQEDVEKALLVLRSAVEHGVNWNDLWEMVKQEQKSGRNPVANLIFKLKLAERKATLILVDDESEGDAPAVLVDVDIFKSAFANARDQYSSKKIAAVKAEKTKQASEQAIKQAEIKAEKSLEEQEKKRTIQQLRKVYWFEKFHWFITSENYLVLSGHDAQQNELLVKRYMRKGDAYIHADLHGASSCILRNINPSLPLSPLALEEAGALAVCRSAAWSANMSANAWWVHPDQVDETSVLRHLADRQPRGLADDESTVESLARGVQTRQSKTAVAAHDLAGAEEDQMEDSEETNVAEGEETSLETDEAQTADDHTEVLEKKGLTSDQANLVENTQGLQLEDLEEERENERNEKEGGDGDNDEEESAAEAGRSESQSGDDEENGLVGARNGGEDRSGGEQQGNDGKGKRISAKERKLMRKGLTLEQAREHVARQVKEQDTDDRTVASVTANTSEPNLAQKRGKKGKMKKLKKYADQDEEDRLLMMEALGNPSKKDEERKQKAQGDGQKGRFEKGNKAVVPPSSESAQTDKREGAPEGYKRPSRAEKRMAKEKEEEEVKQILEEENEMVELPEGEKVDLLHFFIGTPLPEDMLLFALPVCAPYSVVRNYKYAVKLTPGTGKKGKAAKQIMELFTRSPGISKRERELMHGITDNEMVSTIISNVKVSAPGLQAMKSNQKKQQKQKAKSKGK